MSRSSSRRPKRRRTTLRSWLKQRSKLLPAPPVGSSICLPVERVVNQAGTGLVWSPNFSVGVAVFRKLTALAAELMRDQKDYGAWAWEIHHDAKKDAPSGTLLHLVKTMEQSGYTRGIDVGSSRAGKHPGTHEIGFDSAADTITLRHTARSREGFARGALQAARWILSRKGVYTFEEVLFGPRSAS